MFEHPVIFSIHVGMCNFDIGDIAWLRTQTPPHTPLQGVRVLSSGVSWLGEERDIYPISLCYLTFLCNNMRWLSVSEVNRT